MPLHMLKSKHPGVQLTNSVVKAWRGGGSWWRVPMEVSTPQEKSQALTLPYPAMFIMTFFFHKMKKFIFVKHWEVFGYGKLLQCQEFI